MSDREAAPPPLRSNGEPAVRELLASAGADVLTATRRASLSAQVLTRARAERSARLTRWALVGVVASLGVIGWLTLRPALPPPPLAVKEPPSSLRPAAPAPVVPAPAAPKSSSAVVDAAHAPCTPAMVAEGTQPLIDDLEDGDARILVQERRASHWAVFNDGTGTQYPRPGLPVVGEKIPGGRGESRLGLRTRGGKFTKWGASLSAELSPRRCYDASAYAGVQFWARGRAQLKVMVKMTQTVAEEFGGSCVTDCYDSHFKSIKLTKKWQLYQLRWEELAQVGFGTPLSFDPRSLFSLEFLVLPEHTPFDFWVDDVSFVKR